MSECKYCKGNTDWQNDVTVFVKSSKDGVNGSMNMSFCNFDCLRKWLIEKFEIKNTKFRLNRNMGASKGRKKEAPDVSLS